jgi:hypothetical protein
LRVILGSQNEEISPTVEGRVRRDGVIDTHEKGVEAGIAERKILSIGRGSKHRETFQAQEMEIASQGF